MLIDLSCPAEVFRVQLPTEDIPAASLTLFNLSDRVIASVEVRLRLLDAGENETETLAFRGRALNGRPHATFLMTVPCAPDKKLRRIEATVEKVWFADNEVWRRNPANAVEYTPNDLPVSPALTNLKFAAGENAVGFPSRQDGLWICVCGRPNAEGEEYCVRCGQRQDAVFARFSPEAVEAQINLRERQLDLSSRNMREDTIRLQRLREEDYHRRKARRGSRLVLAACLAGAVLLAAGAALYGAPWLRLQAGRRALEAGDPEAAKAVFTSLGDFGNARELSRECDWQITLRQADESRDAASLAAASASLRAMADRPEALEKANETDLLRGRLLLERGDRAGAEEALEAVPEDYPGRAELLRDCRIAQARELMNRKKYTEARAILLEAGDDEETRSLASECQYLQAKSQISRKDWDGAIETLSAIPDYRDSRELTLSCHYAKAEALEAAGDPAGASSEYLMAGDWQDSAERTKRLTYRMAEDLFARGEIREAQKLYAAVPDYEDANEKDRFCRYRMAKDAFNDLEYTRTLELLDGIPDEYEETASLRAEASYEKAKNAVRQGDWATAAELLGSLDRPAMKKKHGDVEALYLQACEGAGIDPYPATPDPSALPEPTPSPVPATAAPEPAEETPGPDPFMVTEDEDG